MSDKDKSKKPPSLGMALFQAFKQIEAGGKPDLKQGKVLIAEAKELSPEDQKWYAQKLKDELGIVCEIPV
jgi:hypothetical protein